MDDFRVTVNVGAAGRVLHGIIEICDLSGSLVDI